MKRVLITGGQGMVGRHAITQLLENGMEVHALGRRAEKPAILPAGVYWHQCNMLTDDTPALIQKIKPDALLHLAWITEHGKFWRAPENLDWVAASMKLVRAFAESGGKRLVISGSCAEYDWQNLGSGLCNEHTPLVSSFLYGIAKDALRRICESYCKDAEISFAWGRIFLLYGEGEPSERLVPSVIRAFISGETARVSHCQQVRDLMSTRDCGRAFAQLLQSRAEGALNIASGRPVKLEQVVETIRTIIGRGDIQYGAIQAAVNEPKVLTADITRLTQEVGFIAHDDLESGLRRIIVSTR